MSKQDKATRLVSMSKLWLFLFLLVLVGAMGCPPKGAPGGKLKVEGDPPPPPAEPILVTSMKLEGTTIDDSAVQAGDLADADGADDKSWSATFPLDDCRATNCLGKDSGETQARSVRVMATRSSDGQQFHKKLTITLYE